MPALESLIAAGHDIVGVVAQPDRPSGRGRGVSSGAVARFASEHGLALHQPTRINAESQLISAMKPDLAVIVAYGALIRHELLGIPRLGWMNLHFSLLPAHRGAAPVQHCLLRGDDISGATTFMLDEGMDTGPIIGQVTEPVRPHDTAGELTERIARSGAVLVANSVAALAAGLATPVPQTEDGASFAPKLTREMARIDWHQSAPMVDRHIRAMTPAPGAWTLLGPAPVLILRAVQVDADLPAGAILVERDRVVVGCGQGAVQLIEVKPAGKRAMSATDWARGARGLTEFQ